MCSYSYLAPSELGTRVRPLLAEPVQRLHFAGEASSSEAPATAHGALESGLRTAQEILDSGAASVVVIGSGFAGTACTRKLAANGVDVTVLEARDRVGGRIWTEHIGGVPAESGASWIHGHKQNPMTDLLDATGDHRYPFDYDDVAGRDEAALDRMEKYQDKVLGRRGSLHHAGVRGVPDAAAAGPDVRDQPDLLDRVRGRYRSARGLRGR
ncbi:FAD-dependent oxidoreductase [Streptomyces sp. MMS24-I2-30]|uniref:FAD-dependent oxidoreductase n=1 Tax=Streptomyces sp. MMS24-I2-30 TaxID=3351564 RepID=UPI003896B6DE